MNDNKLLLLKSHLAQFLGVELEDISNDDAFVDELHMTAADLSDFVHSLEDLGFDISKVDLTALTSVSDLLEALEIDTD